MNEKTDLERVCDLLVKQTRELLELGERMQKEKLARE